MIEHRNDQGQLHCLDGPALEFENGSYEWRINGELHRIDGPAFDYKIGMTAWLQHGEYHREDGPAIIAWNGDKHWYIAGKCMSDKQHAKAMKQKRKQQ
jgi:hypothetical protein